MMQPMMSMGWPMRRLLMGNVAEQVLRETSCPVMTVKEPLAEGKPSTELPAEEPGRGALTAATPNPQASFVAE